MQDLKSYWDDSSSTIPEDTDPSNYAVEKQRTFPESSVVCELGCGTGRDGLYFASKGHKVKLVDISEKALARAVANAKTRGLKSLIEIIQCNLGSGKIPLDSSSCDIVYSRLALHYFKPDILSKLLSEIYRVLKDGGEAWIVVKSPDDVNEMKFLKSNAHEEQEGVFNEDGYIKTRFNLERLKTILKSAGLHEGTYKLQKYVECLSGRKDKVKSGNSQFILSEIHITKP